MLLCAYIPRLSLRFPQGIDLKKAAKLLAQKFATGSSVTKNPQGHDEIVVQGDVSDDILEIIEDAAKGSGGQLGSLFKAVPLDNVTCIEDKKKGGESSA
jgi:density-regulated protein